MFLHVQRMMVSGAALAAIALGSGCAATPKHELRVQAIQPTTAQRVVFLPARCASVNDECSDAYLKAASGIVRGELEFAGYSIVDAETLVAEQRTRAEASGSLRVLGQKLASAKTLAQRGAVFADMPPATKRALMQEARAQGIVSLGLHIAPTKYAFAREVKTDVRYGLGEDGAKLGWISRCTYTPEMFTARTLTSTKVETATRCAIKKALGKR